MTRPWHDRFSVLGDLGEFAEQAERYRRGDIAPMLYECRDEPLDDFDSAVRDLAWEALDIEANNLGVRVGEDLEMRHFLLSDEEMDRLFGDIVGKCVCRDVFVRKNRPPHLRLHDLLHESWHAAAHLAIAAKRILADGCPSLLILTLRQGLQFQSNGDKPTTHRFLNEAATDILAHRSAIMARDRLSSPLLPPPVLEAAAEHWAYPGPVRLVGALCERLSDDFSGKAVRQLLIDYVTGSTEFLTALNRCEPRAMKLLAHAEPNAAVARAVAKQLGYDEVVAALTQP